MPLRCYYTVKLIKTKAFVKNISHIIYLSPYVFTALMIISYHSNYNSCQVKPPFSYIAMISKAILESAEGRLLLCDIYSYIRGHYSYYRKSNDSSNRAWRNSIRHNLSLNECFIKCGRAENGKVIFRIFNLM